MAPAPGHAQLNKGEQLHALRSWLWFRGDGVLRQKQEEAQQEVVRCLNVGVGRKFGTKFNRPLEKGRFPIVEAS